MVAKHRRSETERALASVGAPVNTFDFDQKPGEYDRRRVGGPVAVQMRAGLARRGDSGSYAAPSRYDDGYYGPADDRGWGEPPRGQSWQEWQDWQDWEQAPSLYPDHPSAPVPRIQIAPDHPSRPMSSPRASTAPPGYQRPVGPGWQETTYYRRETGPLRPRQEPAVGRFQNQRSEDGDSLWTAVQVLSLADGQAAQIAQEAEDYAASIREAAEREAAAITQQATNRADAITQQAADQAAAIRGAAEREASELLARLDTMSGELGRVAAYVAESLTAPAALATAPPLPDVLPELPGTGPSLPDAEPAGPDTRPSGPHARPARPEIARPKTARPETARPGTGRAAPDTRPSRPDSGRAAPDTRPTRPGTGPAGPRTTPTGEPQKGSRQARAMRIATAGTAALLSVAVIAGISEIGLRGFPFFVFREAATGETRPTALTDQQFLAKEAAAARHAVAPTHHPAAPKGRHHKKPHVTVKVHKN